MSPHPQSGEPTAAAVDLRAVLRRAQQLLLARPDLVPRYEAAKGVVRAFRNPAVYEVSQRCNLWCEGCYYFEGGQDHSERAETSVDVWSAFFAAEAARGVSIAHFLGAEPALHQERLLAAGAHFPFGVIGTNGTIRLDPAIGYRIHLSVWAGDEETDRKMRGASVFRKALKNYRGDPRAVVVFTLSPWNIASARKGVELCSEHGIPVLFNLWSPTLTYQEKLRRNAPNDELYFRVGRPDDMPCFSDADLGTVRDTMEELAADFPETVLHSSAYADWVTQSGSLYQLDANGVAKHCGARIAGQMKYFKTDLQSSAQKCCTPDIDCSKCRTYNGGWSTRLALSAEDVRSEAAFSDWMEMMEVIRRFSLYERPTSPAPIKKMRAQSEIAGPAALHALGAERG